MDAYSKINQVEKKVRDYIWKRKTRSGNDYYYTKIARWHRLKRQGYKEYEYGDLVRTPVILLLSKLLKKEE